MKQNICSGYDVVAVVRTKYTSVIRTGWDSIGRKAERVCASWQCDNYNLKSYRRCNNMLVWIYLDMQDMLLYLV